MFSGSRNLHPEKYIKDILVYEKPDLVIVGDARGVDTTVRYYCRQLNIGCAQMTAAWTKYGKRAGTLRNEDMVNSLLLLGGTTLYAIPSPTSIGTWRCVEYAKQAGVPVIQITEMT